VSGHLCVAVSDDMVAKGYSAAEICKFVCQTLGGSGGGSKSMAQGGFSDGTLAPLANALVKVYLLRAAKQ
jgi:alanyl-tRNA synthetase